MANPEGVVQKIDPGWEWFNPGQDFVGGGNPQLTNLGGFYNFNQNLSLLFTAGHSIHGESHKVAYVGLYWTWGNDRRS